MIKSPESLKEKLKGLARKKRVTYNALYQELLLERAVARLSTSKELAQHLTFKGGMVSVKCYGSSRYTMDVDAVLHKISIEEGIQLVIQAMKTVLNDFIWYSFQEKIDLQTQNKYGGVRLEYRGGIGDVLPKNIDKHSLVKIDIGIGDPITPERIQHSLQPIIHNEPISWSVYPPESTFAEKLHALIDRGDLNSRSKDIYDLSLLCDLVCNETLRIAIYNTFSYRKTKVPQDIVKILIELDTSWLEQGWLNATDGIEPPPNFQKCYKKVLEFMRKLKPL